jgi:hypothetical protein
MDTVSTAARIPQAEFPSLRYRSLFDSATGSGRIPCKRLLHVVGWLRRICIRGQCDVFYAINTYRMAVRQFQVLLFFEMSNLLGTCRLVHCTPSRNCIKNASVIDTTDIILHNPAVFGPQHEICGQPCSLFRRVQQIGRMTYTRKEHHPSRLGQEALFVHSTASSNPVLLCSLYHQQT